MLKKWENGVSLRKLHRWLIIIMAVMSGVVIYSTYRLASSFVRLTKAVEEHMELEQAAHDLMDASNYLTEQVQRFTINGDIHFLEQYFEEVFEVDRRGEAILKMSGDSRAEAALKQLQGAMNNSDELMDSEYYAMRLVIKAKGYKDYPSVLESITLNPEDAELSPDEKIRRATEIVLSDEYYEQKDLIRRDMQESLAEIEKLMKNAEAEELATFLRERNAVCVVVIIQIISILAMVRLTAYLGIDPILKAVDRINADSPIMVIGADEFRYLAKAYNKMYSKYRTSLEHLNFKASHDALTGAYNRAGYDLLMSGIDLDSTYMMLFDVDDFKSVNDNYGHDAGNQILIKVVRVLESVFRDDDYICRIGGDEFVVLMVHSGGIQRKLIESKMEQINKEMANTSDGLPAVSLSIGIVQGKEAKDSSSLFEKSDAAMYESKKKGKHTYTFYSE